MSNIIINYNNTYNYHIIAPNMKRTNLDREMEQFSTHGTYKQNNNSMGAKIVAFRHQRKT